MARGEQGEAALLASCYRRSLQVAADHGVTSIAFPSISTGVYGYPMALAASLAVATVRETLRTLPGIQEVIFCCFSVRDLAAYDALLAA